MSSEINLFELINAPTWNPDFDRVTRFQEWGDNHPLEAQILNAILEESNLQKSALTNPKTRRELKALSSERRALGFPDELVFLVSSVSQDICKKYLQHLSYLNIDKKTQYLVLEVNRGWRILQGQTIIFPPEYYPGNI